LTTSGDLTLQSQPGCRRCAACFPFRDACAWRSGSRAIRSPPTPPRHCAAFVICPMLTTVTDVAAGSFHGTTPSTRTGLCQPSTTRVGHTKLPAVFVDPPRSRRPPSQTASASAAEPSAPVGSAAVHESLQLVVNCEASGKALAKGRLPLRTTLPALLSCSTCDPDRYCPLVMRGQCFIASSRGRSMPLLPVQGSGSGMQNEHTPRLPRGWKLSLASGQPPCHLLMICSAFGVRRSGL